MCDLCHSFPCMTGCPNEPESEVVAVCPICDQSIYEGEEVAEINGALRHVECLEGMTAREILAMFDVYTEPAAS